MATYKLAKSAQQDVHDLIEYTLETWGEEQSERYYSGFTKQASLLAEMPTLGKPYEPYNGVRVFPYEKHLIYYTEASYGITILHVLHGEMDQGRHVSDSSRD